MADRLPSLGHAKPHLYLHRRDWWRAMVGRGASYYVADGATPAEAFASLMCERPVQVLLDQRARSRHG